MYFVGKKTGKSFNPAVGIAGISCMPTTTKLAQHAVEEENPFAIVIPIAMGCNISGVIVSAIAGWRFCGHYRTRPLILRVSCNGPFE